MSVARPIAVLVGVLLAVPAEAQPMLYAQRLPEGTVYIRLANAMPGAVQVDTAFAGAVALGAEGAARISPYFVAGSAGGTQVKLHVSAGSTTADTSFEPKSGSVMTVVLRPQGEAIAVALIADKLEYNQLKARLAFYNTTEGCGGGWLAEASGRMVFQAVGPDAAQARTIAPVNATVIGGCANVKAPPLGLGSLDAGGLYTVWMMQLFGHVVTFLARDTIAPPRL